MDAAESQEILEEFGAAPIAEEEYDRLIELAAPLAHASAPLLEAAAPRIVVPQKGPVIAEDGTCQLAIMRPCISRGRKLRGLPPCYEAAMLARNAGVFRGWPMFMDHVPPELQEAMVKRGRSITELGGRVVECWYDPDFRMADDEDFGYWPGAIVGRAIPQEPIAAMISRDPDVLHTSINAWPTSAAPKKVNGVKAMVVEGIRSKPAGSVDWVVRGGAGGRVLREAEYQDAVQRAVTSVASLYGARTVSATTTETPDFTKMSGEDLRAYVAEHAPHLSEALAPVTAAAPSGEVSGLDVDTVESMVDVKLAEAVSELREALTSQEDRLEERAQEIVAERESARTLAEKAHAIIDRAAGLTPMTRRDLRARFSVLPTGPTSALAECEATDEKSAEEVLTERLNEDIEHVRRMVAEAAGRPVVSGQGGTGGAAQGKEAVPYWRMQAVAEGLVAKPEEAIDKILGGGEE